MTATPGSSLRDIVVVGGSVAGIRTAAALRRRGFDGRVRVVSAEEVPHYYRPSLSKDFLSGERAEQQLALPLPDDLGLEIWPGASATALDPAGKRLTVRWEAKTVQIGYDGLVVATGQAPRRLPLPALRGIHYVRELAEARALREDLSGSPRVVVIGGGLIGCEVTATCRKLGFDVTVVEAADDLLRPVFGVTVGKLVTGLHRAHGARVLTGAAVSGVAGRDRVESVSLSTGGQLAADVVVVAVGARPRTDWLDASGLQLGDGVLCAPNLRVPGADSVVAVGDVARIQDPSGRGSVRIEHWDNAVRQADTAARAMLEGSDTPPYGAPSTFWTTQYDLQLHMMGHPSATDELRVEEGALEDLSGVATYRRGDLVTAVLALNQPQRLRAYRHLLEESASPAGGPVTRLEGVQR